jgi:DNA modification methylase
MINQIHIGHCLDVLKRIPDNSVHCCVTSPPYYGLRDYGLEPVLWPEVSFSPMPGLPPLYVPAQECCLGLEKDIWAYVGHMVLIFREVWRTLRDDGTLWLNLGDSYANDTKWGGSSGGKNYTSAAGGYQGQRDKRDTGLKPKDLMGIPWRVAYALQADGWYLRSDVIWHKPNPMPESVTDRPTKAHEYVFLLSKSERYFYDADAIRELHKEESIERMKSTFNGWRDRKDPDQLKVGNFNNYLDRETGWGNPAGRNRRTVWTVATQPYAAAHFATFPPKLIEPMILASTSEYGVCGECGAQWAREVEKKVNLESGRRQVGLGPKTLDNPMTKNGQQGSTLHHTVEKTTTGWRPSCSCNAPTVPAVVLDPFMGSGTTAKVALANRRNYIGIDANPTYAEELAPERLNGTQIKLV